MILKGEKVILRQIRLSDAKRFVKWLYDPRVNKFMSGRPVSMQEELRWIRGLKKKKDNKAFAIDTGDGTHIGSINLLLKPHDKKAVLGVMIGDKRYWNKGYGTDALKTIIRYGFIRLRLHRISLEVYEYNPRAIRVYRRLGFRIEGRGREARRYKGKFYDDIVMGLLRREWFKKQG